MNNLAAKIIKKYYEAKYINIIRHDSIAVFSS